MLVYEGDEYRVFECGLYHTNGWTYIQPVAYINIHSYILLSIYTSSCYAPRCSELLLPRRFGLNTASQLTSVKLIGYQPAKSQSHVR